MAMYGWRNLAEAELYTREADRAKLARQAAEQIEDSFSRTSTRGSRT